jgi:serine phosphatase RsbU (regulator of sigma subunit)
MIPLHSTLVFAYFFLGVVLFFLGVVILKENPWQRVHRSTGLLMLFVSVGAFAATFGELLPAGSGLQWRLTPFLGLSLVWELFYPSLLYFALVFPKENGLLLRFPRAVLLIYLPHLLQVILLAFFPTYLDFQTFWISSWVGGSGQVLRPLQLLAAIVMTVMESFYRHRESLMAVLNLLFIIGANVIMSRRKQNVPDPTIRNQVGWVVWGTRLAVAFSALAYIVPHLIALPVNKPVQQVLTLLSLVVGLSAITWAMIRYQFLSARFVFRPSLVFALAAGLTGGVYVWIFSAGRRYLIAMYDVNLPVFEMMFLISALFFFQPVSALIDRLVDKVLHRQPPDYYETMQNISRDVFTHLETPNLRHKILATLADSLDAEPLHLFMSDKNQNLCAELFDINMKPIVFSKEGELVQTLSRTTTPVRAELIQFQISDRSELEQLSELRAVLLAPLVQRQKLLGMVAIGQKRNRRTFTSQDKTLIEVFCSQLSAALENARLYKLLDGQRRLETELSLAREIHKMLLPAEAPSGHTFKVSMLNLPSQEVGGDYLDFFRLNDRQLGLVIGDVSGKGIPGSILMSNVQASFRSAAYRHVHPHQVVSEVNRQLTRTTAAGNYATLVYAVWDEESMQLVYCSAGHNYPIWRQKANGVQRLQQSGPPVGIESQVCYASDRVQMNSGDVIVFYTDGITESLNENNEDFGEERLLDLIARFPRSDAGELLNHIYDKVNQFMAGINPADDMTMIVLQVL